VRVDKVDRYGAAKAVAEHVNPLVAQRLDRLGDIVCEGRNAQGPVYVSRAAVSLKLEAEHGAGCGEAWENRAEGRGDGREGAVQHYKRGPAIAVDLVIHLEPVHRNIAAIFESEYSWFLSLIVAASAVLDTAGSADGDEAYDNASQHQLLLVEGGRRPCSLMRRTAGPPFDVRT